MSEIEDVRAQIAALRARLRPLLREERAQKRRTAQEKAAAKAERRQTRLAQMMAWHDSGLSYREIGRRIKLSRDYVAQLVQSEMYRRRMALQRTEREAERAIP